MQYIRIQNLDVSTNALRSRDHLDRARTCFPTTSTVLQHVSHDGEREPDDVCLPEEQAEGGDLYPTVSPGL